MAATVRMPLAILPTKPTAYYNYTPPRFSISHKNRRFVSPTYKSTNCSGFQFKVQTQTHHHDDHLTITDQRRSGNYEPPIWNFDFIQSLSSDCNEEVKYLKRVDELTVQVKMMLDEEILQLEFIDDLQRLGISYHFDDKIKHILSRMYEEGGYESYDPTDLHSTALRFRLLRQHGFSVSQEVFDCFKNEGGDFESCLCDDTKGLLQLYEASFMLIEGEKTLELAREFSAKFLQVKINVVEEHLSLLVHNALELPLHWRTQRPNSRWFIDAYERRPYNMNPIVLELVKLDFNIVQATHQQELKHVSRWWEQTRLASKLPFARDRLVECYFWTIGGFVFEPQYGYARIMATKVNAFVTTIDDIFDVYGTFEELQLFNNVIQRWDIEAMDKLPYYMQICFLALNNFVDELAYHVLKEQGSFIIPHLRKSWADLCQTYLQEAEWYLKGYTPKFEEYMSNGWISISAPAILTHAYFLVTNPIDMETVQSLYEYHNIVRCSATILRLANDLGTSTDEMNRGDVPKSIQCYMNETGASQEEAREYVRFMIHETWKEMNEERLVELSDVSPLIKLKPEFVRIAADLGRMAQYMYQHGDGHGINHFPQMKDRISSLLFHPIV